MPAFSLVYLVNNNNIKPKRQKKRNKITDDKKDILFVVVSKEYLAQSQTFCFNLKRNLLVEKTKLKNWDKYLQD